MLPAPELTVRYQPDQLETYYDKFYYETYAYGQAYRRDNPHWQAVFSGIAQAIVAEFSPRTVLDAGCGPGVLVEALRERGVDAYGIDISEYAIEHVRADLRPYFKVASISEELDREYDVIVCVEVLEHMPRQLADFAVGNLVRHGDVVLFSSTPDDFGDPSHQNVQPSDYWVGLFARHGAYRDLELDASFISKHAICFRRMPKSQLEVLRDYERRYTRLLEELREVRDVNVRIVADRARMTEEIEQLRAELAGLRAEPLPTVPSSSRLPLAASARCLLPANTRRGRLARAVYARFRRPR